MTFAELAAAIWDQREIQLGTVCGNPVRGIPVMVDRRETDEDGVYWRVSYRTDRDTWSSLFVRIDAFGGHTGDN